jgi:transposase
MSDEKSKRNSPQDRPSDFEVHYRAGTRQKAIAEHYGVALRTVERWVKELKVGMPLKNGGWTQAEDDSIRAQRALNVRTEAVKIEGRSRNAVVRRIQELGLNVRPVVWSEADDAELARLYGMATLTIPSVAKQMKRSPAAVRSRAIFIGIVKTQDLSWTKEQDDQLRDLWKRIGPAQISRILGRTATSIQTKAMRMGLPRRTHLYPVTRKVADRDYQSVKEANARRTGTTLRVIPQALFVDEGLTIPLEARPWLQRKRGECAYPYGERGNIHSCCKPVFGKSVYCQTHSAVCFNYERKAA